MGFWFQTVNVIEELPDMGRRIRPKCKSNRVIAIVIVYVHPDIQTMDGIYQYRI